RRRRVRQLSGAVGGPGARRDRLLPGPGAVQGRQDAPGPAHRASARDARRRERRAGRPEPRARARHPGPGGSARSPWPAGLLSMTGTRPRALRGEQVRLRPFRREDLPRVIAWRRDEELRRGALWSEAAFGPREAQRWLRAVSDGADGSRVTLAVELLAGSRLVGLTNLTRIDRRAGTAY